MVVAIASDTNQRRLELFDQFIPIHVCTVTGLSAGRLGDRPKWAGASLPDSAQAGGGGTRTGSRVGSRTTRHERTCSPRSGRNRISIRHVGTTLQIGPTGISPTRTSQKYSSSRRAFSRGPTRDTLSGRDGARREGRVRGAGRGRQAA